MFGEDFAAGVSDGVERFGLGGEGLEDGVVDDGPQLFLAGGIVGVGGDEDDFVVLGQVGEALIEAVLL